MSAALAAVLILATALRFAYPGVIEFKHDEAMLSLLAQSMADGDPPPLPHVPAWGAIPLTGIPSSVGVPNPPVSVYVMALPYLLTDDPQIATLYVAALNVTGVGLLYVLAHRYLGFWPALVAGVAYAVNPWAVLYSRKIWAQDFQTPFLILALLVAMLGFWEGKRWARVLALPLLLVALQIHFAAWALLPLYAYLLLTRPSPLNPLAHKERGDFQTPFLPSPLVGEGPGVRGFVLSLLLAALVLLPYAIGLARTLERDPNRLANALDRGAPLTFSDRALVYTANFAAGVGIEQEIAPRFIDATPGAVWALIMIGAAAAGAVGLWRTNRRMAGFALLWALLPLITFTPGWTEVFPHYFITAIPALCLLIGGAARLVDTRHNRARAGIIGFALLIALIQGTGWLNLIRSVDASPDPDSFGTPLGDLLPVRDALRPYDDVIVLTDGMEILYDQEPARWTAMLDDSAGCIRALTGDGRAVFPLHPFAVLVAPNAPDNPISGLYTQGETQLFPLRSGEYRLYTFAGEPPPSPTLPTPITPAQFEGGAALTGYALDGSRATLEWTLPGAGDKDYQYFIHFLDAAGDKIGQRDERFWPGRYWCAGDRLLTWTAFETPSGAEVRALRVGLYTLENGSFVNASVVDANGKAVGTWVDIPLP